MHRGFPIIQICAENSDSLVISIATPLNHHIQKRDQHMNTAVSSSGPFATPPCDPDRNYFRFHLPHLHLASVFGDDWFALKAEAFARFFGTPVFLVGQTILVAIWISVNVVGFTRFDVYPFILLNLAFSLQAAYAAPLILLAQTRQADRDKVHADADAKHREALAQASQLQSEQLLAMLQQNTQLTEMIRDLSERIEVLSVEMHGKILREESNS
jgi:uncharacterized membrane protein